MKFLWKYFEVFCEEEKAICTNWEQGKTLESKYLFI